MVRLTKILTFLLISGLILSGCANSQKVEPVKVVNDVQVKLYPLSMEYEDEYMSARTSELKLARLAKVTFSNYDYRSTVYLLKKADLVSSSGVWKSSYPFLLASYLATGNEELAQQAIESMYDEIEKSRGYMSYATPISFTLKNLGIVRDQLSFEHTQKIDAVIEDVLGYLSNKKAQVNKRLKLKGRSRIVLE